ncbi:MAG: hypothetical protein PHE89_05150 [Alphaproteobacteria bacterium]|nr:hypothetical protein [Alphaproteobacteria bacterium]
MRIKNFTALNMSLAMDMIRRELGEEAIIISSGQTKEGGVTVTAAIEKDDIIFKEDETIELTPFRRLFDDSTIRDCLEYHFVIDVLQERILSMVRTLHKELQLSDDKKLLEECFATIFSYADIMDLRNPVKIFTGVTGSGKSTAIAKVATQAKLKKLKTLIISTDNVRAGANKQLESFATILQTEFKFVKAGKALFDLVEKTRNAYDLILIDTPGINPFVDCEVEKIVDVLDAVKGDVILTMDCGRNTYEAVEIADIFVKIGATYLLPTRLDLTRRIGSILSVASCLNMSFCSASVSGSIVKGLASVDYKSLAKLILA